VVSPAVTDIAAAADAANAAIAATTALTPGRYSIDPNYAFGARMSTSYTSDSDAGSPGKAVQVEMLKSMLEAPGTKRLKLPKTYHELVLTFAFKFNMRR